MNETNKIAQFRPRLQPTRGNSLTQSVIVNSRAFVEGGEVKAKTQNLTHVIGRALCTLINRNRSQERFFLREVTDVLCHRGGDDADSMMSSSLISRTLLLHKSRVICSRLPLARRGGGGANGELPPRRRHVARGMSE